MERIIEIDGKKLKMVANAKIPRLYRNTFSRDLIVDMDNLLDGYKKSIKEKTSIPIELLTIFENVAWIFLKEGGEDVKNTPDEWLESIDGMFSIYQVLPEIIKLWHMNNKTTSSVSSPSKKNNKKKHRG